MTAVATNGDDLRSHAARLAFTLIRFESVAGHPVGFKTPQSPPPTNTGYTFLPSSRAIQPDQVESFLVGLPCPAVLAPTMTRGAIALLLLDELSGDRKRWAEKTMSNFSAGLEEMGPKLGLSSQSRILVEFDDESHLFSFAAVHEWTQQFVIQLAWNLGPIENDGRADARMGLIRSDWQWFKGRSYMGPGQGT
ncbi:MAG: hypothetical protein ABI679_12245 [Gemmatimonadota bacterium]